MNDTIKMALVTGFYGPAGAGMDRYSGTAEDLARFAALIRADEREQCAKVCEDIGNPWALDCAAAIRSKA
jgi:hypothetical protein